MIKIDPMADGGCPQCKWITDNYGSHLDDMCALHQAIYNLQEDRARDHQTIKHQDEVLDKVRELVGCDLEDDLVRALEDRIADGWE
jgi:hypothetical protein